MDSYRILQGPPQDCQSYPFLKSIMDLALPKIDPELATLEDLQERDRVMFFPHKQIYALLNSDVDANPIRSILECKCKFCCEKHGTRNMTERVQHVHQIVEKPMIILLAILIYIGHAPLIGHFATYHRISDTSLDSVTDTVRSKEEIKKFRKLLAPRSIDMFCNLYNSAKNMFQPAEFRVNSPTMYYLNTHRMPFMDEIEHDRGSSGKVYKFNIHPDFLDEGFKDQEWSSLGRQVSFGALKSSMQVLREQS